MLNNQSTNHPYNQPKNQLAIAGLSNHPRNQQTIQISKQRTYSNRPTNSPVIKINKSINREINGVDHIVCCFAIASKNDKQNNNKCAKYISACIGLTRVLVFYLNSAKNKKQCFTSVDFELVLNFIHN